MVAPFAVPVTRTAPLVTVRVTPELMVSVRSPDSVSELMVLLEVTVSLAVSLTLSAEDVEPLTVEA